MVKILDDFEGSIIGGYSFDDDGRLGIQIKKEAVTVACGVEYDYNLHFWFGVSNDSPDSVSVDVLVECEPGDAALDKESRAYSAPDVDGPYEPVRGECLTDGKVKYAFRLSLGPDETVYVANTYPRNFSWLENVFPTLAESTGAKTSEYGKSVEGRALRAYLYSSGGAVPTGKPIILITSGFHPPEPDTFTTEATMEYLGTKEGKEILETCDVVVAPVVNPDGFFHGAQGSNVTGTNIYWKFIVDDPAGYPESYHLYRLALELKPAVYVDYHAYTFQMERKEAGPYVRPECCYRGKTPRSLAALMAKDLISLNSGGHMAGPSTIVPTMLSSMLNDRFNTITFAKYHVHLMDGVDRCRSLGVQTLKIIAARLKTAGIKKNSQLLIRPHGDVSETAGAYAERQWLKFKYLTLLPIFQKFGYYT